MATESTEKYGQHHVKGSKGHTVVGLFLSVIGFFWLAGKAGWLAQNTDWFPHHTGGSLLWPLVMIAVGLLFIFGRGSRRKRVSG